MGHQVELAGLSIDTRHFIDGVRLESKETFEDISPIDGSHLANISRGGVPEKHFQPGQILAQKSVVSYCTNLQIWLKQI
jgi:hypothetical protein